MILFHGNGMKMRQRKIFIAGGTGYLGSHLIPILLERGHEVTVLVRKGSETKVYPGCRIVSGDALNESTYKESIQPADTFVHLVGVAHPSPSKAELFRTIDLPAAKASVAAATASEIQHFVYLSVAHPASVMKVYVQTRMEAEQHIRDSGLNATFLRPWYVLGPGHRWAYLLIPFYWILERVPSTKESARRLGLVTLKQMIASLVTSIENPHTGIKAVDVPEIRKSSL
jgi:uncharacterized protein YbjT (DUF2867 family)